MNIVESSTRSASLLCADDFTIGPYLKACEHYDLFIEHVWDSDASLSERTLKGIKHLAIGLLFSIPLVNIVAMIGYAILSKHNETTVYINGIATQSKEIEALQRARPNDAQTELSTLWLQIQERQIENAFSKIRDSFEFISALVSDIELENYSLMLSQASDFHNIHTHLTRLSKYFGPPGINIDDQWLVFLKELETVRFNYPDHTVHMLDLTRERFIFENPDHLYSLELSSPDTLSDQELREVVAIEKESFTNSLSKREIRSFVRRKDSKIILAKEDKKVVGVLMYRDGLVTSVARQADAIMGIGLALFKKLDEELADSPPESIKLQVRNSNDAAISLYERIGFVFQETLSDYYSYPTEDGMLMSCEKMKF